MSHFAVDTHRIVPTSRQQHMIDHSAILISDLLNNKNEWTKIQPVSNCAWCFTSNYMYIKCRVNWGESSHPKVGRLPRSSYWPSAFNGSFTHYPSEKWMLRTDITDMPLSLRSATQWVIHIQRPKAIWCFQNVFPEEKNGGVYTGKE